MISFFGSIYSAIMSVILGSVTIIGSAIMVLGVILVPSKRTKIIDTILHYWALILLKAARVELIVKGREHIPSGGCLFIFNHLSNYDIPILFLAINKTVRFGAKAELYKIPFFAQAMHVAGNLKIERTRLNSAIQTLNSAVDPLRSGARFVLAAEGTRQVDPKIGDFKSGPFILAIQAQALIVPAVLHGPDKIVPKTELFVNCVTKKKVYVEFLPPVDTKGFTIESREILKSKIREQFVQVYAKYDAIS